MAGLLAVVCFTIHAAAESARKRAAYKKTKVVHDGKKTAKKLGKKLGKLF